MAITLLRRHPLLTSTLGAILFVTAVATATAIAPVPPAWQHGGPHLGGAIAALSLVGGARVVWPAPNGSAAQFARRVVLVALALFAAGQLTEAVGAFDQRLSGIDELHAIGVAASAVGLVLGLVGTALSAVFWLLGRRGEVDRRTMWFAGAGAIALAAAYVGAAIVFGF